jgi:hypothetical protein
MKKHVIAPPVAVSICIGTIAIFCIVGAALVVAKLQCMAAAVGVKQCEQLGVTWITSNKLACLA